MNGLKIASTILKVISAVPVSARGIKAPFLASLTLRAYQSTTFAVLVEPTLTEAGLRSRSLSKRAVALAMVDDREHCREAWVAAGFAVEFALKAYIARRQGFDRWPSAQARPDLHVHTLRKLLHLACIDVRQVPISLRASMKQVLDWERRHDYLHERMPRKMAMGMVEAAFGSNGVFQWLNGL